MSSVSVTSNKREKAIQDLESELESLRAMNSSLRAYLNHLHIFKGSLSGMHKNCKQLAKVNLQWIDVVSKTK